MTLPDDEPVVRPFFLTRGRTKADLPMEAMVVASGLPAISRIDAECREILELCQEPMAVAELAGRARLPLGVVRVLVADLAQAGLVELSQVGPLVPSEELLERLIRGVSRL